MRRGFTLIELLVVVAIVAAIGAGIAVTYGHDMLRKASAELAVKEMADLREAFRSFHADHGAAILRREGGVEGMLRWYEREGLGFLALSNYVQVASLVSNGVTEAESAYPGEGSRLQIPTPYGGCYSLIWYEHCADESAYASGAEPACRRLLVFCAADPAKFATCRSREPLTGNRRYGIAAFPMDERTKTFPVRPNDDLFFMELLNLDYYRE